MQAYIFKDASMTEKMFSETPPAHQTELPHGLSSRWTPEPLCLSSASHEAGFSWERPPRWGHLGAAPGWTPSRTGVDNPPHKARCPAPVRCLEQNVSPLSSGVPAN